MRYTRRQAQTSAYMLAHARIYTYIASKHINTHACATSLLQKAIPERSICAIPKRTIRATPKRPTALARAFKASRVDKRVIKRGSNQTDRNKCASLPYAKLTLVSIVAQIVC